ncbi:hypothetical protein INT43_004071 [Umbelopsis isabellina]|uniref:Uncharacterized protein n=1 Tax=Mortierella isabellina TaxID=91625 RepID=A0A8H7PTY2_MORIS|nr:hypothetical protein INT43_004071 [Umbelopsis isabellina]
MTGLNAETQTVINSDFSTPSLSTQLSVSHKNWFQDKLQPYASEIVFVWNSILLFEDPVLTSSLLALLGIYLGLIVYFSLPPISVLAIVGGTIYLGQETNGFGLINFVQHRMAIAAAQRPRRDFSQICEILDTFVDEITSLKQSLSELKQKQPILVNQLFSTERHVTGILITPATYEWGISNHMNGDNRTVIDKLNTWCTKPNFGCKSWVKITEVGMYLHKIIAKSARCRAFLIKCIALVDDAEWEKDFSSIPETDDEIPVLVVPKGNNEQNKITEDSSRSNVDDIATLIKQLTEDAK